MSLTQRITCTCGTSFEVPELGAAQRVKCPKCGALQRVVSSAVGRDSLFLRDVYQIRQRMLRISEKYDICDEDGEPLAYAERPSRSLRGLASAFASVVVFFAALTGWFLLCSALPSESFPRAVKVAGVVGGFVAAFVVALFTAIALSVRRDVTLYRDDTKQETLLAIAQDEKFALRYARYTVRDAAGTVLGRLSQHQLMSIVRKYWSVYGAAQAEGIAPQFVALEDSQLRALLRRFLGPLLGLLRTHFVLVAPGEDRHPFGEFRREATLRDRYTLDLRADLQRNVDRRLALAIGILLDTGERR